MLRSQTVGVKKATASKEAAGKGQRSKKAATSLDRMHPNLLAMLARSFTEREGRSFGEELERARDPHKRGELIAEIPEDFLEKSFSSHMDVGDFPPIR